MCEHCPPAAAGRDTYTLLKFYNLSSSLLNSIFQVLQATVSALERRLGIDVHLEIIMAVVPCCVIGVACRTDCRKDHTILHVRRL